MPILMGMRRGAPFFSPERDSSENFPFAAASSKLQGGENTREISKKKMVGSLLLMFVMVVGGWSVMIQAPGVVTGVGGQGKESTRGELPQAVSLLDALKNEQENNLQEQTDIQAYDQPQEESDNVYVLNVDHDNPLQLQMTPSILNKQTDVNLPVRTRSGGVDLDGPYGPVDEGECIHFIATVDDPELVLFRFDWNNDSVWDTDWDISMTGVYEIDHCFGDNYYGEVIVEAWDGYSTQTFYETGTIFADAWVNYVYWGLGYWNWGWRFQVLEDGLSIGKLAAWRWSWYYHRYIYAVALWDDSGTLLGSCDPNPLSDYSWNWCDLPSNVDLNKGDYYMVSMYMYGMRFVLPKNSMWPSDAPVDFDASYYYYANYLHYPQYYLTNYYIAGVDFEWVKTYEIPLTYTDGALTVVRNVAPTVFNAHPTAPIGYEGSPTSFIGEFTDPGWEDEWTYRWKFGDGSVSDWYSVKKYLGGADVLILHTWSNQISSILPAIKEACGNFCTSIETWDFGPLGENSAPSVDYMKQFDVILTGVNYFPNIAVGAEVGDNLADYMDAGGNVVTAWATLVNDPRSITGRFKDDLYNAAETSWVLRSTASLGTIYVPGHPILQGVSSVSATWRHLTYDTTPGATRIADWSDGRLAIAVKENPIVPNGALSVALQYWPTPNYASGDWARLTVNALKFASRQPEPVLKKMPITTDPVSHIYKDDDPVTTSPQDDMAVTLELKDDDDGKILGRYITKLQEGFEGYSYPNWPSGWYSVPYSGWRCLYSSYLGSQAAQNWYYYGSWYGFWADLYGPTMTLSDKPYMRATLSFDHYWWANWGGAAQDGYVQVSVDGGITWQTLIEFHHNNPGRETASYEVPMDFAAGHSDVRLRFHLYQRFDWTWQVDNVKIVGAYGTIMNGYGSDDTVVTIANVPPTAYGGPTSGLIDESGIFDFVGYKITDPALWEPTEWFAYKWNFDDGTGTDWVYKGSLAPPHLDILVMHSFGEPYLTDFKNALEPLDLVGTVEYWDFFNTRTAPTAAYMMNFDILMWGCQWAWLASWWNAIKRQMGDGMADYLDAQRGGVITLMATYDLSPWYGDVFALLGRYADEDYGAFEKGIYSFGDGNLGVVHYPDHQVMKDKYVVKDLTSHLIHSGDYKTTEGGIRLASWSDGGAAIGVKEIANGARSVNYCGFEWSTGDFSGLLRNAMAWDYGAGIPTDDIYPEHHMYGDNGVYYADITLIDDDMGWTWDLVANQPVASPIYPQSESHYIIPVEVNNVDPLIYSNSVEVYIAAEFCLRVSGTEWHTVALSVYEDGVYYGGVSVTREAGDPNDQAKCTMMKIDMMEAHDYSYEVQYQPLPGMESGSNPSWVIISPWREPITPGHGTVTYKHDFDISDPTTWTQGSDLPTIKTDLLDGGKGAKIGFEVTAFDEGTDDLAFMWVWGDSTPYGIHVHHNDGTAWTEGIDTNPENVGYTEPWFDKAANDIRSPHGTINFMAHDVAYHGFQTGYYYYVVLIVMDDDVNDAYPSPFGHPGIDMEFINLDLR